MKLALIRRSFSATGGAELYLQRLLAGLVREGHEVDLFAEKWEGQAEGVVPAELGGRERNGGWDAPEAVVLSLWILSSSFA